MLAPTGQTQRTVSVDIVTGPAAGIWTVTFKSQAVPGTLAVFAGTLAAAHLSIVSAVVSASGDMVVDSFDVTPLGDDVFGVGHAGVLRARAAEALNGHRDVAAELRRIRSEQQIGSDIPAKITLDETSEISTGIHVSCADRVGLLYDIASTISRFGLRVRAVSALTFAERASDTFRVVDESGGPVRDGAKLDALRLELLRVCG